MLLGKSHDKNVDWWALGIMIYELLAGIPPFYNKDTTVMFNNIKNMEILWPKMDENKFEFSKEAVDVIKKLLQRDPTKRLGFKNDADEILQHKFFRGINI